jgi:hypothetical protein
MVSNRFYYARRAAQEFSRASQALTCEAREFHQRLAENFAQKAQEHQAVTR